MIQFQTIWPQKCTSAYVITYFTRGVFIFTQVYVFFEPGMLKRASDKFHDKTRGTAQILLFPSSPTFPHYGGP